MLLKCTTQLVAALVRPRELGNLPLILSLLRRTSQQDQHKDRTHNLSICLCICIAVYVAHQVNPCGQLSTVILYTYIFLCKRIPSRSCHPVCILCHSCSGCMTFLTQKLKSRNEILYPEHSCNQMPFLLLTNFIPAC